ncbi:MAG: hypothetical protein HRT72_05975, partial [Flavobacteriales bacterium]|nr:hypothetical protein [Flavobacteriales bacterium]
MKLFSYQTDEFPERLGIMINHDLYDMGQLGSCVQEKFPDTMMKFLNSEGKINHKIQMLIENGLDQSLMPLDRPSLKFLAPVPHPPS